MTNDNKIILERMRGVPAQPGTAKTDVDPQNPNIVPASFRGVEFYLANDPTQQTSLEDIGLSPLEMALRGIVNHWREFGDMIVFGDNRDDYGLGERMDAAAKLLGMDAVATLRPPPVSI